MANAATITVAVNLTGDLSDIVRAFDLMGVALAGHGHVWTDEERAAYEKAIRICTDTSRRVVETNGGKS